MGNQAESGWSGRKRTLTVGGTLTAVASIVTIVSFFTSHNSSSPTPNLGPSSPSFSLATTVPAATPAVSTPPAGSTAAQYLNNCRQNIGDASYCQCTLNWLDAHVSQSQFATDMTGLNQYEQNQTSEPPPDMVTALAACTNSS